MRQQAKCPTTRKTCFRRSPLLLLGATPFAQPSDVIHSPGFCLSRYLHPSFSLFFDPSLLSSGSVVPPSSVPPCYSPSPLSLSLCRRCSRRTQAARRAKTWSCGEGGEGRRDRRHSRGLQSPCQRPTPPRPFGASPRRCTRRAPSLPRGAAAAGQPRKRSSVGKRAVRAEPPHCFPMHMPVRQSFRSSRWRNMWSKPWS